MYFFVLSDHMTCLLCGSSQLEGIRVAIQPAGDTLIDCKGDGLTGGNTEDTRGDTLVESPPALVLQNLSINVLEASPAAETLGVGSLLDTGLDNINRVVDKGTHSTRDKTDAGSLVAGQLLKILDTLEVALQEMVCGEISSLVTGLAQGGEADTTVKGTETFLANDGVGAVGSVAVLGDVQGISHGVTLGLKTDFDDIHRSDDQDGLGDTSEQTS